MMNLMRPGTIWAKGDKGASLLSYGLVVGLIAVVAIGAVSSVGDQVGGLFTNVGERMDNVVVGGGNGDGDDETPAPPGTPSLSLPGGTLALTVTGGSSPGACADLPASNTGTAAASDIWIGFSGGDSAQFQTCPPPGGNACGISLAAGSSCNFGVQLLASGNGGFSDAAAELSSGNAAGASRALSGTASGFAPTGCPNIGDRCGDGSIYVGDTPDGNVKMYATACDHGFTWTGSACSGSRSGLAWNDGSANFTNPPTDDVGCSPCAPEPLDDSWINENNPDTNGWDDTKSGANNTATLAAADANSGASGTQFHAAAKYCEDLAPPDANAHGFSDWYLPAIKETNVIWVNRNAGVIPGTLDLTGADPSGRYWSSTEDTGISYGWYQQMNNGTRASLHRYNAYSVRCVRK
jgi:Flp pilus assembly pilin Flp